MSGRVCEDVVVKSKMLSLRVRRLRMKGGSVQLAFGGGRMAVTC